MDSQPTAAHPRIVTCDPVPGYSPQIGRYVAQMTEVRADLLHELEGLTLAQLDWHPDEQTESIGTLLLHLDGVEWSWIHEDIFGAASDAYPGNWAEAMPIRVGVPQVQGRPLAAYLDQLAATRARTLAVLRDFTDADLARLVGESEPPPGQERRSTLYTIDWIIWHIIEHEATHVGQVELLRRLAPSPAAQQ
ncbi:MAG TPA: DinB family protein [Chloroflexia bacterium]